MYPWPMAMRDNNPTITSAEMSIAYRFHEFIISRCGIFVENDEVKLTDIILYKFSDQRRT
jgi:hypothetical protein